MWGIRDTNIEMKIFNLDGFRIDIYEYDINHELQPISKLRCELIQPDLSYHIALRCPRNSFRGELDTPYYMMVDRPRYITV